jgi:hypothetical protein
LSSSGKNVIIKSVTDNGDTIISVSDMTAEGVYEAKRLRHFDADGNQKRLK